MNCFLGNNSISRTSLYHITFGKRSPKIYFWVLQIRLFTNVQSIVDHVKQKERKMVKVGWKSLHFSIKEEYCSSCYKDWQKKYDLINPAKMINKNMPKKRPLTYFSDPRLIFPTPRTLLLSLFFFVCWYDDWNTLFYIKSRAFLNDCHFTNPFCFFLTEKDKRIIFD